MNISNIRDEFRERSGLLSLVDTECDLWINRGIRYLDLVSNFHYSPASVEIPISPGEYRKEFSGDFRVVYDVYLLDTNNGRSKLTRLPINKIREMMPNPANTVPGIPNYYSIVNLRAVDFNSTRDNPELSLYASLIDTIVESSTKRGIVIYPPNDSNRLLEIYGKFYSPELNDSVSENWWSIYFPDAVVSAALYKLNLIKYRNTEGAKDYLVDVMSVITAIDYDIAEDDVHNITGMEG